MTEDTHNAADGGRSAAACCRGDRPKVSPADLKPGAGRREPPAHISRIPASVLASAFMTQERRPSARAVPLVSRGTSAADEAASTELAACAIAQTRACGHARPDDRFHSLGGRRLAIGLPRIQLSSRARRTTASPRRSASRSAPGRRHPPRYRFRWASDYWFARNAIVPERRRGRFVLLSNPRIAGLRFGDRTQLCVDAVLAAAEQAAPRQCRGLERCPSSRGGAGRCQGAVIAQDDLRTERP